MVSGRTPTGTVLGIIFYLEPNVISSSSSSSGEATDILTGGFGKFGSSSPTTKVGLTRTEVARL
jgi:hypothetical protein